MLKNKIILFIIIVILPIHYLSALQIIKDQEIDSFFEEIMLPINKKFDKKIKIFLINSDDLNAFTDGKNIYIYSGLLRKFNNINELIGVIGHETGHINAGHSILRKTKSQTLDKASLGVLLLGALGALMGSANGLEMATAATLGGISVINANFLQFSQEQESVADNLGTEILSQAGYSPVFLNNALKAIYNLSFTNHHDNFYFNTHPPLKDRIYKTNLLGKDSPKNTANKHKMQVLDFKFQRILSKLDGYLENEETLNKKYKENSDFKAYAMIINQQVNYQFQDAQVIIEELEKKWPKDIFLLELKAQNYYAMKNLKDSLKIYHQITQNFKKNSIINLEKLNIMTNADDPQITDKALSELYIILSQDYNNYIAWYILAKLAGKNQQHCLSYLALMKTNQIIGNTKMYNQYLKILNENHDYCQAEDIEQMKKFNKIVL